MSEEATLYAMGRLAGFKYRDVTRKLRALGFEFDRSGAGSHEIWVHSEAHRMVTLPCHPGDMKEGTLRAILRQADISVDDFLAA